MNNAEILLGLKTKIEDSKIKKAQLEGGLATFKEQLKKEFDCENIVQAQNIVVALTHEIKEKEKEFENILNQIEEMQ